MEREVWDTDNLEPWQIDQLLEMVRLHREKEWKTGEMVEEEEDIHDDNTYSLYSLGEGENDRETI